jgi:hypothetical protein
MPDGVMYSYGDETRTVYFANPQATLSVKLADGQVKLVPWGRRKTQIGHLPLGGWARLPTIYQGRWNAYMPKPVRLPILKFMEKDFEGSTHWYDVVAGNWIQGLLARENEEVRVYIVTITPELHTTCHDRWPRIVTSVVD